MPAASVIRGKTLDGLHISMTLRRYLILRFASVELAETAVREIARYGATASALSVSNPLRDPRTPSVRVDGAPDVLDQIVDHFS